MDYLKSLGGVRQTVLAVLAAFFGLYLLVGLVAVAGSLGGEDESPGYMPATGTEGVGLPEDPFVPTDDDGYEPCAAHECDDPFSGGSEPYPGGDVNDMDADGRTYDDVDADGDGMYESDPYQGQPSSGSYESEPSSGGDVYDMDNDGRTYDDVDADGDGMYES